MQINSIYSKWLMFSLKLLEINMCLVVPPHFQKSNRLETVFSCISITCL